jgi:hypothetical protein
MNDLMHVSLKQIQMLVTFDKYNLLLLYDNNHYIYIYMLLKRLLLCFSNVHRCFTISLRGKVERATICPPPRHARAHPLTCLW